MRPKKAAAALCAMMLPCLGQEGGNAPGCPFYARLTPVVLLNDGSNSARLEISAPGATSVTWQPSVVTPFKIGGQPLCQRPQQTFILHDDGLNGDNLSGDGVFSINNIQFDPAGSCASSGYLSESQGVMAGWHQYTTGTIVIKQPSGETDMNLATGYYITLPVAEAQMFRALDPVTPLSATSQQTPWLINVRDDNFQVERAMNNLAPTLGDLGTVIANLSGNIPDNYSFRTLVSTTTTACDVGRTQGQHLTLKSNVSGNGEAPFDHSSLYGTPPNLLGVTFMANFYQGLTGLYYHETMHQWGAFLSKLLGVSDGAHWLQASSVAGALGGCSWMANNDGTYSTAPFPLTDGDLELYVTGFLPAAQVRPTFVAAATPQNCNANQVLKGPYKQVTIQDVINLSGPRVPAWDPSVKIYKNAIVVTSQNRLLSPLEMTYYGRIAQLWEGNTIELGANPPYQWPVFTRGASALNMLLDSWTGPVVRATAIASAASGSVGAVSPGEILALYGSNLGPANLAVFSITPDGKIDTTAGGTQVLFDGLPAPMLYSSAGQVSTVVPYELDGRTAVSVQVSYQGKLSPVISLPVAPSAPAIFTQDQSGQGAGAILNYDSTLNTPSNPAARGSIIQIFGTGEGQSTAGAVDGAITAAAGTSKLKASATIGGVSAGIEYAGPAPFEVAGLFQLNADVPLNVGTGAISVVVQFGTAQSQRGVVVYLK